MKTSEVLFKAAELFDSIRWIRGRSQLRDRETGELVAACALGAIEAIAIQSRGRSGHNAMIALRTQLEADQNVSWIGVSEWNDDIAKDKRQVQRKMRKVARLLAKEGQ